MNKEMNIEYRTRTGLLQELNMHIKDDQSRGSDLLSVQRPLKTTNNKTFLFDQRGICNIAWMDRNITPEYNLYVQLRAVGLFGCFAYQTHNDYTKYEKTA